jgi:predicted RNase H-like HicB family nuclease
MVIPVLIEPIEGGGFRAMAGSPLMVSAEGRSQDEALSRLRDAIRLKLAAGSILVPLDVPPAEENPSVKYAGMFRDDPLFDEWVEAMAENRRRDQEEFEREQQEAARE